MFWLFLWIKLKRIVDWFLVFICLMYFLLKNSYNFVLICNWFGMFFKIVVWFKIWEKNFKEYKVFLYSLNCKNEKYDFIKKCF